MAAATGLTLIKKFTYRGAPEEYSNTYWLTGGTPADATAWRALFDAMVVAEKTVYPGAVTVVRGYGYADDSGHKTGDTGTVSPAIWSVDMTISPNTPVTGTLGGSISEYHPGDAAVWERWRLTRRNEDGKPIYLRKYFHPAARHATLADTVHADQVTALNALGAKLQDGTFISGRKLCAAGHESDVIESHGASAYVTTRSLKRRGKRPTG